MIKLSLQAGRKTSRFPYILTLNRDKIENEERKKLIKMDIDSHCVAAFTKDKKFLGRSYQESVCAKERRENTGMK